MSGGPETEMLAQAAAALDRWPQAAAARSLRPLRHGHIHHSFVAADGAGVDRFLLQRLNTFVFREPEVVMRNIERTTEMLRERLLLRGQDPERHCLRLVSAAHGEPMARLPDGACWRLYHYIERSRSLLVPGSVEEVYQAARAIGRFQADLAHLDPGELGETIPRFHHTPSRFAALERAAAADPLGRLAGARPEVERAFALQPLATALLDLVRGGQARHQVVHNDAKIANVLFDQDSPHALCVIDLDTVMPGLLLYDFGEMTRTMATRAAEDTRDLAAIVVDPERWRALCEGYLETAGDLLSATERRSLALAGQVMAYENAIRFLADHLEGDPYYGAAHPGHNLERCRAQLAVAAALRA